MRCGCKQLLPRELRSLFPNFKISILAFIFCEKWTMQCPNEMFNFLNNSCLTLILLTIRKVKGKNENLILLQNNKTTFCSQCWPLKIYFSLVNLAHRSVTARSTDLTSHIAQCRTLWPEQHFSTTSLQNNAMDSV